MEKMNVTVGKLSINFRPHLFELSARLDTSSMTLSLSNFIFLPTLFTLG